MYVGSTHAGFRFPINILRIIFSRRSARKCFSRTVSKALLKSILKEANVGWLSAGRLELM